MRPPQCRPAGELGRWAAIVPGTGGVTMWRVLVGSAVVAAAAALLLRGGQAAWAQKDDKAKKAKVSGTIAFKGEARFEAGTLARVTLQDVSLADAPARKLGEQVIKDLKKFPIRFEVEYDPAAIEK